MSSAYETVLKELEESYNEGKIDEVTYIELRENICKKDRRKISKLEKNQQHLSV